MCDDACSRQEGYELEPAEVKQAIELLDKNQDGLISFEEFVDWWVNQVRAGCQQVLLGSFWPLCIHNSADNVAGCHVTKILSDALSSTTLHSERLLAVPLMQWGSLPSK